MIHISLLGQRGANLVLNYELLAEDFVVDCGVKGNSPKINIETSCVIPPRHEESVAIVIHCNVLIKLIKLETNDSLTYRLKIFLKIRKYLSPIPKVNIIVIEVEAMIRYKIDNIWFV